MVEKFDPNSQPLPEVDDKYQSSNEQVWIENQLINKRLQLKELSGEASNLQRAEIELEIAEFLIGLNKYNDAWETARPLVEMFITEHEFQSAVKTFRVLYQSDHDSSIVALAQGCWLAVTYPINPALSIEMLHSIVDETPDQSDGAAVAAMAAHFIADMRGNEQYENLTFLTKQILAKVAKRHRNIEDEESIKIWIEILDLNDTDKLFARLAKIIDVLVADNWWFDRDQLRAQLPVN